MTWMSWSPHDERYESGFPYWSSTSVAGQVTLRLLPITFGRPERSGVSLGCLRRVAMTATVILWFLVSVFQLI